MIDQVVGRRPRRQQLEEPWGNPNPYGTGGGFPSEHPALLTLIWTAAFIAVFAPLGVRRYRATSH